MDWIAADFADTTTGWVGGFCNRNGRSGCSARLKLFPSKSQFEAFSKQIARGQINRLGFPLPDRFVALSSPRSCSRPVDGLRRRSVEIVSSREDDSATVRLCDVGLDAPEAPCGIAGIALRRRPSFLNLRFDVNRPRRDRSARAARSGLAPAGRSAPAPSRSACG